MSFLASLAEIWLIAISTSMTSSSAGLLFRILFMSGLSLPERVGE